MAQFGTNESGAIYWPNLQLKPSGGQFCNWCKWLNMVAKFVTNACGVGLLRCLKKRLVKRLLLQAPQAPFKAPIHSKCFIGGFKVTGLALEVVLRCDWPLCDLRFKSYEHFKLKIFLSRNLMYLTAKILRTVHWKCTSQIKTPAELQNVFLKVFYTDQIFQTKLYPKKSAQVATNLTIKLNEIEMNDHFWVEKAENSIT